MISAQALSELMELGLEGERLLAVVRIIERDADRHADRHIVRDAERDAIVIRPLTANERAQRYRAKKALKDAADGAANRHENRHAGRDAAVTRRDADLFSLSSTSSYLSDKPKEKETKKEKRERCARHENVTTAVTKSDAAVTRKHRAVPLPEDFSPSDSHFDAAQRLGRGSDYVYSKMEDMRLWARSNGTRKVDWSSTLHSFMRRDAEKGKGHVNGKRNPTMEAFAELKLGIEGHEIQGDALTIDLPASSYRSS